MSLLKNLHESFPFPYSSGVAGHLRVAGLFAGFVFIFLQIFKPFGLGGYGTRQLLIIAGTYAITTFGGIMITAFLLPLLLPSFFKESAWTTGRQILLMLVVIGVVGLANYVVSPFVVETSLSGYYLAWFEGITLLVAAIPVSFFILLKQNLLLKKFSRQARDIDHKLHKKKKENEGEAVASPVVEKIKLTGDYQREEIQLFPDELYMITSAGNYVKVFHWQKGKLVYSIIRSTLKKTEEALLDYPNFFKCHRAFIINLDKVVQVEGTAQGYKIRIEGQEELIPVSRNLNSEFADKLLAFKGQIG